MSLEAMRPAVLEKGILDGSEYERLHEEMSRVEHEKNVLCVSNYVFSAWAVKT